MDSTRGGGNFRRNYINPHAETSAGRSNARLATSQEMGLRTGQRRRAAGNYACRSAADGKGLAPGRDRRGIAV